VFGWELSARDKHALAEYLKTLYRRGGRTFLLAAARDESHARLPNRGAVAVVRRSTAFGSRMIEMRSHHQPMSGPSVHDE
jgi:hypothetical protein